MEDIVSLFIVACQWYSGGMEDIEHDCEGELTQHEVLFVQFHCDKCGYEAFIRAERDKEN